MKNNDLFQLVNSLYPKIPWDSPVGRKYKNTVEQRRYRALRKLTTNNFGKSLRRIAERNGYHFCNHNVSHGYCFEYAILCNKTDDILDDDRELIESLGGSRTDIRIYISKISNLFTMYYEKTILEKVNDREIWTFERVDSTNNSEEIYKVVLENLIAKGMKFLDYDELSTIVPNIETEFTDLGNTTLFNLLFTPLHEHFVKKVI